MRVSDVQRSETQAWKPAWMSRAGATVLLTAIILFTGISVHATSWYVDNSISTGSKNGTSWANAWTSLGSISWGSVKAGDTVYVSGGTTSQIYYETLTIGSTGTSGSPITISVGQDAGHTGQVILDGQSSNGNGINLASYVTISGNNGSGATNLVIRNWTDTTTNWNGIGIYGYSMTGVTIQYVEFYTVNNGITDIYPDLTKVAYCYFHDIRGDHGVCFNGSGLGSGQSGFGREVVHNCVLQLNSNMNGDGYGPDGIQGSSGGTVYSNNIYSGSGTVTGGQHQDGVQILGEYWQVYANTFTDMANSCDEVSQSSSATGHYYFYNNVCRIATPSVNGYQRGVEWDPVGSVTSITDVHIINNVFVDLYGYYATGYIFDGQNPSISNFEIKNNLYINSGSANPTAIYMDPSSGYSQADVSINNNVMYAGAHGSAGITVDGSSYSQAQSSSSLPTFVSYSARNANNDFHLQATDTVAKDKGLSFASYFTVDKDGISRPQGPAWDIGPYEYHTTTTSTNPVIAVTPPSQSFGTIGTGTSASQSFTVQNTGGGTLTGSASVAAPYSILSGSNYSLTNGQSQAVTVQYSPIVAGTNNQNVTFTGGGGATVAVTGSATVPLSGLTFAASSATITAPFVLSGGAISQSVQTGVTNGGTATFSFTITNAGSYVVQAIVNAPGDSENSFYVNIDGQPTDPYMVWQVPVTTNYQTLLVSWQGNGTYDNSEFVPEIFTLTAGTHQLIFVGREMNTYLQQVSILKIPSPPAGLHVVPGS
jgi:hypothetical protein